MKVQVGPINSVWAPRHRPWLGLLYSTCGSIHLFYERTWHGSLVEVLVSSRLLIDYRTGTQPSTDTDSGQTAGRLRSHYRISLLKGIEG